MLPVCKSAQGKMSQPGLGQSVGERVETERQRIASWCPSPTSRGSETVSARVGSDSYALNNSVSPRSEPSENSRANPVAVLSGGCLNPLSLVIAVSEIDGHGHVISHMSKSTSEASIDP